MRAARLTLTVIVAFGAVGLVPTAAAADTRYVETTGDDSADCSSATPCKTIRAALLVGTLSAGDIIDVGPGRFEVPDAPTTEVSTAGVTIRGEKAGVSGATRSPDAADETIIDAARTDSVLVSGGNVTFDGVAVTGSGIRVTGSGFTFQNSIGYGIDSGVPLSSSGGNLTINDSSFVDNLYGVYQGAVGLAVTGSVFTGNKSRTTQPNPIPGRGILYENPTFEGAIEFNRFAGNDIAIEGQDGAVPDAPSNFFGCNEGPGQPGCDPIVSANAPGFLALRLTAASSAVQVASQVQLDAGFVVNGTDAAPSGIAAFPATAIAFSASPSTASVLPASPTTADDGVASTSLTASEPGLVTATAAVDYVSLDTTVQFNAAPVQPAPTQPAPAATATPAPVAAPRNPLAGTDGNDRIVGTPGDDIIDARAGNDVIDGQGGNDIIIGGTGNDRIIGGAGRDRLVGGAGDDRMIGGSGEDRMSGGSGRDTMSGGADDDQLAGESGGDHVYGNDGDDDADGGTGEDRVRGDSGDDIVNGGAGDDRADGGSGRDRVVGSSGDDGLTGGSGNDRLLGGLGDDRLYGGSGRDVLSGGPGTDRTRQS